MGKISFYYENEGKTLICHDRNDDDKIIIKIIKN